ncbi:MAG: putative zinc-ribbon domain [Blastocatellia bacterium]
MNYRSGLSFESYSYSKGHSLCKGLPGCGRSLSSGQLSVLVGQSCCLSAPLQTGMRIQWYNRSGRASEEEGTMDDQAKADLEKLETLREQALCGPPEQREAAEQAYEELRTTLFDHQACEIPDDDHETKELPGVAAFTCENCGQAFALTAGEQQMYEGQGMATPKICKACRGARKDEASQAIGEGEGGGVGGPFTL